MTSISNIKPKESSLYFRKKKITFFYFLIFVLNYELLAQDANSPFLIKKETIIDETYKSLSNSLFYLSNKIDSFFGGERADDLPNGSRLRLFWNFNKEEGTSLKGKAAVRLNLALVETQKKFKVSFKNAYEKEYEKSTSQSQKESNNEPDTAKPEAYDIKNLLRWRIKVDSGIQIDIPPDPFVRLSVLKSWPFGLFELRPSQQFYWYLKNGFAETTKIDLDRPIRGDLLFRYENDATWTDNNDYFTFFSGPILFHQITDSTGLSYAAKVLGESRPQWSVSDYRLELVCRQLILRKWFFVEFNPYVHFPKANHWDSILGFNLRFELVVGSY
jgi:hypothetical protein